MTFKNKSEQKFFRLACIPDSKTASFEPMLATTLKTCLAAPSKNGEAAHQDGRQRRSRLPTNSSPHCWWRANGPSSISGSNHLPIFPQPNQHVRTCVYEIAVGGQNVPFYDISCRDPKEEER